MGGGGELESVRRQYSDEERGATLTALDANGGNVSKTARETGVPRKTVEEWRDGRHVPEVANIRQGKRRALADELEELAYLCLDLLPDKLNDASAAATATALGIAVDKMQVLRGKPSSVTLNEYADLSAEDIDRELDALANAARTRARKEAPSGEAVPLVN